MVLGPSQYGGGAGQTFCLLGEAVYLDQEDLPPPGKVVRLDQSKSLPCPLSLFVWEESFVLTQQFSCDQGCWYVLFLLPDNISREIQRIIFSRNWKLTICHAKVFGL